MMKYILVCLVGLLWAVYGRQLLEPNHPFNQDISSATLHPSSSAIISALDAAGGWGTGKTTPQIDFTIHMTEASTSTPMAAFAEYSGFYYKPDCDTLTQFPLPTGGNVEGSTGGSYACSGWPGPDCHVLVVDVPRKKVWEGYYCNQPTPGGTLTCGCGLSFDMCATYPASQRGERCTSCDAAGFSIAALLPTPYEVATNTLNHAIRFILPNARMLKGGYVHPASHAGGPTGTNPNLPYYGTRMRLKASFNVTAYNNASQVVLRAMQKYGILLSDGGNLPFTFAADDEFSNKWSTLNFGPQSLKGMQVTDFEVVQTSDGGGPIVYPSAQDCVINTLAQAATCSQAVTNNTQSSSNGSGGASGSTTTATAGSNNGGSGSSAASTLAHDADLFELIW